MNNAAINFCVDVFMLVFVFISLGSLPRNGIAEYCQTGFQNDSLFYVPTRCVWGFQFLNIFIGTCDYLSLWLQPPYWAWRGISLWVWRSCFFGHIFQLMDIYWLTLRYQLLSESDHTHSLQTRNRRPLHYFLLDSQTSWYF